LPHAGCQPGRGEGERRRQMNMARDFLTCLVCGALAAALVWYAAYIAIERFSAPPVRDVVEMWSPRA
jgi:hypothetical protein